MKSELDMQSYMQCKTENGCKVVVSIYTVYTINIDVWIKLGSGIFLIFFFWIELNFSCIFNFIGIS